MGRKSKRKKLRKINFSQDSKQHYGEMDIGKKEGVNERQTNSGVPLFLIEIIRWGAYLALFAPLVVHPAFFFPFVVPKTVFFWIFTEIIVAAWLLLAIPNRQFRPTWNPISIALGAFLFVTIFTSFSGVNTERSFWSTFERMAGTVNWIHLGLFFLVLVSVFKTVAEWRKLLTASFIASCVVALLFLVDRLGIAVIPFETRNGATIGNSSFMAAYLLFNVFFGIWLLLKTKGEWQKIFYGVGLGTLIFSMMISTAYGALTSMFGGFFILLIVWLFFAARFRYARLIAIALFFLGIFAFSFIAYGTLNQNKAIVSKLPYYFSDAGTIGARRVVWEMAWQGIKERPILGWGPENFNVVFTKYFNPCLVLSRCGSEVWFDKTHNALLDQLIHSGIVGLIAYLAIFAAIFTTLFRIALRFHEEWLMPGVIIAGLASYFVQNLLVFDMPSSYLMLALTLAFAGGMTNISSSAVEVKSTRTGLVDPSSFTIVAVGLLFVYFVFSFGFQSFQAANWGIAINRSSMPLDKKIELYKKSLAITRLGNRQTPEFFTNNLVSWVQDNQDLPEGFVREAIEIMSNILARNPIDFRHHLILGNLYNAARRYDPEYINGAEEVLLRAVELSPKNQQGLSSLSQTYLYKGDYEKAITLLERSRDLEPRFEQPHWSLLEAYVVAQKYEYATTEVASIINSNFIPSSSYRVSLIVNAYEGAGDYDKAIAWHKELAESEVGKNSSEIHFRMAELYREAGNKSEARVEALRAKELDSSLAEKVEEFLKSLK